MIDWNKINETDTRLVHECMKRAGKLNPEIDGMALSMDLTAAHINQPLKLEELLATDDGNFGHDVFGIQRHIDRDTGELSNCFLPRFQA